MKSLKVLLLGLFSLFALYSCQDEMGLNSTSGIHESTHVHDRSCAMHDHMEKLLEDPAYRKQHESKFVRIEEVLGTRALCSNPPVLPVAVHYQNVTGDAACLIAHAQNQIQILNDDFQGSNSDISTWTNVASNSFPGVNHSETCVAFCIADQNHPTGYGLVEGQPAVTINQTTGDNNSDFSGYLNIFVQFNTGVLGYSPLGGLGNGDGVVIEASAFGSGAGCGNVVPQSPFDLGRTTTHEVGHYLLLDHIWGGGCNQDDLVADTPDSNDAYYGCPNIGDSTCGSTDMHMNYMDYTNDACMYMFSDGQGNRAENYVSSSLAVLTNNTPNVCSGNSGGGSGGGGNGGTCGAISDLTGSAQSDTEISISWTAIPNAELYRVRYKQSGTSTWTNFDTSNDSELIGNLQAATDYRFNVRVKCASGWTAWSNAADIATNGSGGGGNGGGNNAGCGPINDLGVSGVGSNDATISWTGFVDATRYLVRYKKVGTSSWTQFFTNNTSEALSGLLPDTEYIVRVRVKCPSGWTSWASKRFTTLSAGGGGNGGGSGGGNGSCNLNTITFELTLDDYGSETTWELVNDDTGATVLTGGPFQDGQGGTVISETFCISDACYTVYVDDSYGDGICCQYGNGSFQILDVNGAQVGASDGNFGYYDYIDFCVANNIANMTGRDKDVKSNTEFRMPKNAKF